MHNKGWNLGRMYSNWEGLLLESVRAGLPVFWSQTMKSWKANEQLIARMFGYIGRNSLSGDNSKSGSTADNHPKRIKPLPEGRIYIECKRRKKHYANELYMKELPKARKERKVLLLALVSQRKMLICFDPKDIPIIAREYREGKTVDWSKHIKYKRVKLPKANGNINL